MQSERLRVEIVRAGIRPCHWLLSPALTSFCGLSVTILFQEKL